MKKSILAIAIPLIMLSGCHTMSFSTSSARGDNETFQIHHNALFDIIEIDPINLQNQCKSGLAVTTVKETFLLNVLSGFTQGLWNPRSVDITCAPKKKN